MKKTLLFLLTFCALATSAQNEIVVGDMDDSGGLTIGDVTALTDAVLHPEKVRTISTMCDPNFIDNTAIAGVWCIPYKKLYLTTEGKASISRNSSIVSFEYYPFRGDIVFFNADGDACSYNHVIKHSSDRLVLSNNDGSCTTYYLPEYTPSEEHEYVDLGLPSGTLWATTNIGALAPEDFGDHFAWGETEPKSTYKWSTYFDSVSGSSTNFKKYNYHGKATLTFEDDAAYMNWGEDWCTPSSLQQNELVSKCTWTWDSAKKGYTVVGPNENSIFLPADGYFDDSSYYSAGYYGRYWSRSLYNTSSSSSSAYSLNFDSSKPSCTNSPRYYGYSIRPVRTTTSQ